MPAVAAHHPLATQSYVRLTTFRRDGTPVATPVWIAPLPDPSPEFVVITVDDTGKTKRLAHTDRVTLQACDRRGRIIPDAPTYSGVARVERGEAAVAEVRTAIGAKYGIAYRVFTAIDPLLRRLRPGTPPRAGIYLTAADGSV